jgi:hypothetical protein
MIRRVRACTAASRHGAGEEKGRTVTWSREGKGDGPAIGSICFPDRLVVGHRLYRAGDLRSNRSPGAPSGAGAA